MAKGRRLTYGEGTVYPEYDKTTGEVVRWRGELRTLTGRCRVSGTSRPEALKALDAKKDELAQGPAEPDDVDEATVGGCLAWWVDNVGHEQQANTEENYRWAIAHLRPLSRTPLAELTVEDIEELLARKTRGKRPLGHSSLVRIRTVMAMALDEAQRRRKLDWNPARLTRIPKGTAPAAEKRSLTVEEAKALLEAADGDRYEAMVILMLHCGLRPGEVTGLQWKHVNLKTGQLDVVGFLRREPDGTLTLTPRPKSKSDRRLALPDNVVEALRGHQVAQKAERLKAAEWEDWGLVFCTEIGTPIDPSNLRREVTRLCDVAGVEPISPNELRHTAASLLVASGLPLEEVSDVLGHKDTRMLAAVYRHKVKRVVDVTEAQARMLEG